jgi:hypothetical protein
MWNLLAMGSSYQRGLEEGMKTGFSAVQLFQTAQTEQQLNDAKYEGSILGWARRNYDGRVKGFTVFNPNSREFPKSYELKQAVNVLKKHMGNRADEVDASLGLPDIYGGDKAQQQAIRKASKNPAQWFSKVVKNLLDENHDAHGITPVEEYSIKDDDVEYSGDALSFINERGAKLLFTRGSVAGRIEPIQGKIKPEHLTPSPYNQRRAKIRVGTSSSDEATVPLSLFSTFRNAGIEENEAKQSAQTLETDFRDVRSSEDEKDEERIQQKYFASAKKREDDAIIARRLAREMKKLS